ncbi:MAG: YceI family protein [Dehalococcoidia bacterium]|nr:YceI family protein [Dehalococcoidia bacterium]
MTSAPVLAPTRTWTIDPAHSIAEFAVKHLVVTTVKGRFRDLDGTIRIDEARPENSRVSATIAVASIDTNAPDRDAHLRSDDFFNAERYPKMTFHSTRVERINDTNFKVYGDLTIRDVTKEVVLDTEYQGQVDDPWGGRRAGFTATAQISRNEFNVKWNQLIETGGVAVGDDVKITLHIEAVRQD